MKTPIQPPMNEFSKSLVKNSSVTSLVDKRNKSSNSPIKRNNTNKLSCQYCNDSFLTDAGLCSHLKDHCDRKQFLLSHAKCLECGEPFGKDFDAYVSHLNTTGHAHRNGRIRSASVSEYAKSSTASGLQAELIDKKACIFFGSFVLPGAAVAGCAWVIVDEVGEVLSQGSCPVNQSVPVLPSALKVEIEAMAYGLNAAIELGIAHVIVKTSSESALSYLRNLLTELKAGVGPVNPFVGTDKVYCSIRKSLTSGLRLCDLELISHDQNYFINKMAETVVLSRLQLKSACDLNTRANVDSLTTATVTESSDVASSEGGLSLLDLSGWLRDAEPLFKVSPRTDISPRDYGRTPKNNNAFTSWTLPSNFLG